MRQTLTRRDILNGAALAPLAHAQSARRPNVILILTDDQGYGDLGCHGNRVIQTPNMDRLHGESVRFTNFHVDPLCAPTRSALMTGRYSCRTGVWATVMGRSLLRRDETTMADLFSANGYRTGIFGKWHLGDNHPYHPWERGFQECLVNGGGGVTQTPDYWGNSYFNDTYFRRGRTEKTTGYCTDVWFRNATRFVEQNRRDPFFLYLPTNAPHWPYRVAEKYSQPYRDQGLSPDLANFYGMITNLDENLGRLLGQVKRLGLEEQTIFVFMTDNGTAAPAMQGGRLTAFNAGMRDAKASAYDGGHRVPCFVRWPGGGIRGGRDVPSLACHFDVLPTFMELAGLRRPPGPPLDGISLAPALRGTGEIPDRALVVQTQQRDVPEKWKRSAVMTNRWRLVNGSELYDMQADPAQARSVAAQNGDVIPKLRDEYEKWWGSVSQRFGERNPIVIGSEQESRSHLTCHDWHAARVEDVPWHQELIKKAPVANGVWALDVARAGRYQVLLRQQPEIARFPIAAHSARLKIGAVEQSAPVPAGASAVAFTVELPAGPVDLQSWLNGNDGNERGAYFVDIRRVG